MSPVNRESLSKPLIIGIGNRHRGDDGVGRAVAELLRGQLGDGADVIAVDGEAAELIDAWRGRDLVIAIDACRSASEAGSVHRFDNDVPAGIDRTSTHGFGLAEAFALARNLDRAPARLLVYAIEGACFETGTALSPAVAAAVGSVACRIRARLHAEANCTPSTRARESNRRGRPRIHVVEDPA